MTAPASRFFSPAPRDGHALFDLGGYVAARLERAGVGQIEDLGLCTYADPARFFSYRRTTHRAEPDYGRHVNAIALRLRKREPGANSMSRTESGDWRDDISRRLRYCALSINPAAVETTGLQEKPAGTRP